MMMAGSELPPCECSPNKTEIERVVAQTLAQQQAKTIRWLDTFAGQVVLSIVAAVATSYVTSKLFTKR